MITWHWTKAKNIYHALTAKKNRSHRVSIPSEYYNIKKCSREYVWIHHICVKEYSWWVYSYYRKTNKKTAKMTRPSMETKKIIRMTEHYDRRCAKAFSSLVLLEISRWWKPGFHFKGFQEEFHNNIRLRIIASICYCDCSVPIVPNWPSCMRLAVNSHFHHLHSIEFAASA